VDRSPTNEIIHEQGPLFLNELVDSASEETDIVHVAKRAKDGLGTQLIDIPSVYTMRQGRNQVVCYFGMKSARDKACDGLVSLPFGMRSRRLGRLEKHAGQELIKKRLRPEFLKQVPNTLDTLLWGGYFDEMIWVIDETIPRSRAVFRGRNYLIQ